MENDIRERRTKSYSSMKSLIDFIRGGLILAIGIFIIFAERFGTATVNIDNNFRYFFGGLSIVYGGWRIYRGFKKDPY